MKFTLSLLYLSAISFLTGCEPGTPMEPRGWYHVGSNLNDEDAPGGFGQCKNLPKKCQNGAYGKAGESALIIFPDELVNVRGGKAMVLRLVNRTDKTASFLACDSTLYIVQEARDKKGQWKAVEHFPVVICGNSFHRVFLESNEYWEVHARVSEGRFKTTLRFRLEPEGERGITAAGGAMYSHEYEGNIDPNAFVENPKSSRGER